MSEKLSINPLFSKQYKYWRTVEDILSHDSKDFVNSNYVEAYVTEQGPEVPEAVFNNRVKRTYAITFSDAVIDEHVGSLSQQVDISGFGTDGGDVKSIEDDIIQDFDGMGNSVTEFNKQIIEAVVGFGKVGVLLSGPTARSETLEQQRLNRERTFGFIYKPQHILYDSRYTEGPHIGELKEVILYDGGDKENSYFRRYINNPEIKGYTYKRYQTKKIASFESLSELEAEAIAEDSKDIPDTLGIPFFIFGRGPQDSFVNRVSHLDVAILNRLSTYSNVNYKQGFRQIIFSGVRDVKEFLKKISENIVGAISGDIGVHQIPAGDPTALENEIRMLMHWARRIGMYQMRQLTDDLTKQTASAESKAKDLQTLESIYNSLLDMIEKKWTSIFKMIVVFERTAPSATDITAINCKIARDFDLTDSQFDLEQDKFILLVSSTFDKKTQVAVAKEVAKKYLSKMRYIPSDGVTEEQARKDMLDIIDAATEDKSSLVPPTGAPQVFGAAPQNNQQPTEQPQAQTTGSAEQQNSAGPFQPGNTQPTEPTNN